MIASLTAAALWLAPWPPATIEAIYSRWLYAGWQPLLTSLSNRVPWALADVLIAVAVVGGVWLLATSWRGWAAGQRVRSVLRASVVLATCAAALATWFLLSWGLNYRRVPLSAQLDHDAARIDVSRLRELATLAVSELNALHAAAHARPWPDDDRLRQEMTPPFAEALRRVGLPVVIVAGRSKPTLLGPYLEAAGIAGFTNPFTLDVVIVPAALPVERPALLLHEWAHLAGLAHEADAGFLGWLAGMQGREQLRYSAWLDLLPRLAGALPEGERRAVTAGLGEGPRADYRAIAARLARVRPAVRDAAWSGYGRFLEANRVAEGLRSYDGVVGLVAGTAFDEGWRPRHRRP